MRSRFELNVKVAELLLGIYTSVKCFQPHLSISAKNAHKIRTHGLDKRFTRVQLAGDLEDSHSGL